MCYVSERHCLPENDFVIYIQHNVIKMEFLVKLKKVHKNSYIEEKHLYSEKWEELTIFFSVYAKQSFVERGHKKVNAKQILNFVSNACG